MSTLPAPDVLRGAVRTAVAANSLRAVAVDVGLSHRGLRMFLDGSTPRESTLRKLREWYVRNALVVGTVSPETGEAALAILLERVPELERRQVRAELLGVLLQGYRKSGIKPPEWIEQG